MFWVIPISNSRAFTVLSFLIVAALLTDLHSKFVDNASYRKFLIQRSAWRIVLCLWQILSELFGVFFLEFLNFSFRRSTSWFFFNFFSVFDVICFCLIVFCFFVFCPLLFSMLLFFLYFSTCLYAFHAFTVFYLFKFCCLVFY